MRSARVFWGVFLLVIGAMLLLERFGMFTVEWSWAWKFWPLLLILLGIAVLLRNRPGKPVLIAVLAVAMAVVVMGMIGTGWHWSMGSWRMGDWHSNEPPRVQEFTEPFDSTIHRASFTFQSGAGTFIVADTTRQLVDASTETGFGQYICDTRKREDGEDVTLKLEGENHGWHMGEARHHVVVRLNPVPVWDMRFDVGASSMDVDLSRFAVERVVVSSGASSVRMKLGDRAEVTRVAFKSGVSSLNLRVPESSGCEIHVEAPLSSKNFRNFVKSGSGLYRTENFDDAARKIYVELHAGVSSLSVTRDK